MFIFSVLAAEPLPQSSGGVYPRPRIGCPEIEMSQDRLQCLILIISKNYVALGKESRQVERIAYSSTIRLTWVIPQDLNYHLNFSHRDPGVFRHPGNRNCIAAAIKFYYCSLQLRNLIGK